MVKYAITQYKANANRVYSTGDSSGGMMTQLLMAVYPDIFKAGSAFAGVPAGCSNVFDGTASAILPRTSASIALASTEDGSTRFIDPHASPKRRRKTATDVESCLRCIRYDLRELQRATYVPAGPAGCVDRSASRHEP